MQIRTIFIFLIISLSVSSSFAGEGRWICAKGSNSTEWCYDTLRMECPESVDNWTFEINTFLRINGVVGPFRLYGNNGMPSSVYFFGNLFHLYAMKNENWAGGQKPTIVLPDTILENRSFSIIKFCRERKQ